MCLCRSWSNRELLEVSPLNTLMKPSISNLVCFCFWRVAFVWKWIVVLRIATCPQKERQEQFEWSRSSKKTEMSDTQTRTKIFSSTLELLKSDACKPVKNGSKCGQLSFTWRYLPLQWNRSEMLLLQKCCGSASVYFPRLTIVWICELGLLSIVLTTVWTFG